MAKEMKLTERKRADIIKAAVSEFIRNGYSATSMDGIAEKAGVSKRTIYKHFPGKEEMFRAIILETWEQACWFMEVPYSPDAPLREQLAEVANREIDVVSKPDFVGMTRAIFSESLRSPELVREILTSLKESEGGLVKWIRRAVEDKRLAVDDPHFASEQFIALLKAFVFWPQVLVGHPAPTQELREKVVNSTVEMFLGQYEIK